MSPTSSLRHGTEYPYDELTPTDAIDWCHVAARGVLADLCDRLGIKHELDAVDDDVRVELVTSLADIIRSAHFHHRAGTLGLYTEPS